MKLFLILTLYFTAVLAGNYSSIKIVHRNQIFYFSTVLNNNINQFLYSSVVSVSKPCNYTDQCALNQVVL